MNLHQTVLSKSFSVEYKGKFYYVNYTNSDGQTLALMNRANWEIVDEDYQELHIYEFNSASDEEKEAVRKNLKLFEKLIKFCIRYFYDYKPEIDID